MWWGRIVYLKMGSEDDSSRFLHGEDENLDTMM